MSFAQTLPTAGVVLPRIGTMLHSTPAYVPAQLKGLTLYPDHPLKFDFIIHPGDEVLQEQELKERSTSLIKYFLAALTVPEDELWVNLSPVEADRIISDQFAATEMGRDVLAQDYILKQLMASLMYPEEGIGKKFWKRVYAKAQQAYGHTDIPVDIFNKVWITPERASVYEHENTVYVVDSYLKVMLASDYEYMKRSLADKELTGGLEEADIALSKHQTLDASQGMDAAQSETHQDQVVTEVIREILIKEIEREVNEGAHFALLRQIYDALILATWFKQNLKESFLGQVYVDQNKAKGVHVNDPAVHQRIYDQYLEAFRVGVYNYIKEEVDTVTGDIMPKKYFSGGLAMKVKRVLDYAMRADAAEAVSKAQEAFNVTVDLAEVSEVAGAQTDAAMVFEVKERLGTFKKRVKTLFNVRGITPHLRIMSDKGREEYDLLITMAEQIGITVKVGDVGGLSQEDRLAQIKRWNDDAQTHAIWVDVREEDQILFNQVHAHKDIMVKRKRQNDEKPDSLWYIPFQDSLNILRQTIDAATYVFGSSVADGLRREIKEIRAVLADQGITPKLAILHSQDSMSRAYLESLKQLGRQFGIVFDSVQDTGKDASEIKDIIEGWNNDPDIHGIIPVGPFLLDEQEEDEIKAAVAVEKDVDGVNWNLSDPNVPSTNVVESAILLAESITDLVGKNIVVVGRGEVGLPLKARLSLLYGSRNVSVVPSQTPNRSAILHEADIIFSAVDKPNVIKGADVSPHAIVIDVTTIEKDGRLIGSVEPELVKHVAALTPVPGGVGAVTRMRLMLELLKRATQGDAAMGDDSGQWSAMLGDRQVVRDENEKDSAMNRQRTEALAVQMQQRNQREIRRLKALADTIKSSLGISPRLVILSQNGWVYDELIALAEQVGVELVIEYPESFHTQALNEPIQQYQSDNATHGIWMNGEGKSRLNFESVTKFVSYQGQTEGKRTFAKSLLLRFLKQTSHVIQKSVVVDPAMTPSHDEDFDQTDSAAGLTVEAIKQRLSQIQQEEMQNYIPILRDIHSFLRHPSIEKIGYDDPFELEIHASERVPIYEQAQVRTVIDTIIGESRKVEMRNGRSFFTGGENQYLLVLTLTDQQESQNEDAYKEMANNIREAIRLVFQEWGVESESDEDVSQDEQDEAMFVNQVIDMIMVHIPEDQKDDHFHSRVFHLAKNLVNARNRRPANSIEEILRTNEDVLTDSLKKYYPDRNGLYQDLNYILRFISFALRTKEMLLVLTQDNGLKEIQGYRGIKSLMDHIADFRLLFGIVENKLVHEWPKKETLESYQNFVIQSKLPSIQSESVLVFENRVIYLLLQYAQDQLPRNASFADIVQEIRWNLNGVFARPNSPIVLYPVAWEGDEADDAMIDESDQGGKDSAMGSDQLTPQAYQGTNTLELTQEQLRLLAQDIADLDSLTIDVSKVEAALKSEVLGINVALEISPNNVIAGPALINYLAGQNTMSEVDIRAHFQSSQNKALIHLASKETDDAMTDDRGQIEEDAAMIVGGDNIVVRRDQQGGSPKVVRKRVPRVEHIYVIQGADGSERVFKVESIRNGARFRIRLEDNHGQVTDEVTSEENIAYMINEFAGYVDKDSLGRFLVKSNFTELFINAFGRFVETLRPKDKRFTLFDTQENVDAATLAEQSIQIRSQNEGLYTKRLKDLKDAVAGYGVARQDLLSALMYFSQMTEEDQARYSQRNSTHPLIEHITTFRELVRNENRSDPAYVIRYLDFHGVWLLLGEFLELYEKNEDIQSAIDQAYAELGVSFGENTGANYDEAMLEVHQFRASIIEMLTSLWLGMSKNTESLNFRQSFMKNSSEPDDQTYISELSQIHSLEGLLDYIRDLKNLWKQDQSGFKTSQEYGYNKADSSLSAIQLQIEALIKSGRKNRRLFDMSLYSPTDVERISEYHPDKLFFVKQHEVFSENTYLVGKVVAVERFPSSGLPWFQLETRDGTRTLYFEKVSVSLYQYLKRVELTTQQFLQLNLPPNVEVRLAIQDGNRVAPTEPLRWVRYDDPTEKLIFKNSIDFVQAYDPDAVVEIEIVSLDAAMGNDRGQGSVMPAAMQVVNSQDERDAAMSQPGLFQPKITHLKYMNHPKDYFNLLEEFPDSGSFSQQIGDLDTWKDDVKSTLQTLDLTISGYGEGDVIRSMFKAERNDERYQTVLDSLRYLEGLRDYLAELFIAWQEIESSGISGKGNINALTLAKKRLTEVYDEVLKTLMFQSGIFSKYELGVHRDLQISDVRAIILDEPNTHFLFTFPKASGAAKYSWGRVSRIEYDTEAEDPILFIEKRRNKWPLLSGDDVKISLLQNLVGERVPVQQFVDMDLPSNIGIDVTFKDEESKKHFFFVGYDPMTGQIMLQDPIRPPEPTGAVMEKINVERIQEIEIIGIDKAMGIDRGQGSAMPAARQVVNSQDERDAAMVVSRKILEEADKILEANHFPPTFKRFIISEATQSMGRLKGRTHGQEYERDLFGFLALLLPQKTSDDKTRNRVVLPMVPATNNHIVVSIDRSDEAAMKKLRSQINEAVWNFVRNEERWASVFAYLRLLDDKRIAVDSDNDHFREQVLNNLDFEHDQFVMLAAEQIYLLGKGAQKRMYPILKLLDAGQNLTEKNVEHEEDDDRAMGIDRGQGSVMPAARQVVSDQALKVEEPVGGIDLDPAMLNLKIRRDGQGVPLPINQQPIKHLHIEGFIPIIINIQPMTNLPLLLGLNDLIDPPTSVTQDPKDPRDRKARFEFAENDQLSQLI